MGSKQLWHPCHGIRGGLTGGTVVALLCQKSQVQVSALFQGRTQKTQVEVSAIFPGRTLWKSVTVSS